MIRLETSKIPQTAKQPQGGWRVAVVVDTDGIPGRKTTGVPAQICSGAGATKEEAASWALHHLRRISREGEALLQGFGATEAPDHPQAPIEPGISTSR